MKTDSLKLRPELAWPVQFSAEEARAVVNRRMKGHADLQAALYHHPFLGLVFQSQKQRPSLLSRVSGQLKVPELIRAHVLVDLVGGRAYLSDAWDLRDFVAISQLDGNSAIRDPAPQVEEAQAVIAARAVLAGVVLRRRRITPVDRLELVEPPRRLGKPNWWITNRGADHSTEVIVDGLTGRHYAFSV